MWLRWQIQTSGSPSLPRLPVGRASRGSKRHHCDVRLIVSEGHELMNIMSDAPDSGRVNLLAKAR